MNSSNRQRFFQSISFIPNESELTQEEITLMTHENLLYMIDEIRNLFTISLKGIIFIEYEVPDAEKILLYRFINDLNKEYFDDVFKKADSSLNNIERAIIITLMGLLSVSSGSAIKLTKVNDPYSNVEDFKECVNMSVNFLKELGKGYYDSSLEKIWAMNAKGEDPVVARIARTDDIQKKTNNIYTKVGGKHYLDILKNGHLGEEKTKRLIYKIFDKGGFSFEERILFNKTLDKIYSDRYKLVKSDQEYDSMTEFLRIKRIVTTLS